MKNNIPNGCFVVGKAIMCHCKDCGKLVRLNKLLLGSLHICLTEEEKKLKYEAS